MKNFKDILTEAITNIKKVKSDVIKQIKILNKDRIGKTIMNINNSEIKNSIVLSESTFAIKRNNKIEISVYNYFNNEQITIELDKKEIDLLGKI